MLRAALEQPGAAPRVRVSIGDDAAVLSRPEGEVVWSIDAAVEGVHFRRDLMSLEDAGYRATMAALSDLGAMGAVPVGVLAALTLPRTFEDAELLEMASGQRAAALACETAIVGGNLARGDVLTITTTVLGEAGRPVLRAGASAGDVVALAGPVGLAGAGLAAALRGAAADDPSLGPALAAFRRPTARLIAGRAALERGATAMIDVSDGLATDVTQLADAGGITIELDEGALVEPALARAALALGQDALELALSGGEDYALVATFTMGAELPPSFRRIGRCVPRAADAVVLARADGSRSAVRPSGFDHFSVDPGAPRH
jgi:thiamine-monophosphate kinase